MFQPFRIVLFIGLGTLCFGQTVSLEADYLRYDQDESVWASGNVHLNYGDIVLEAKKMIFYARQNQVVAQGGVSVNFRGRQFRSEKLSYSLKDEAISFNVLSAVLTPVEAEGPLFFECDELQKHEEVYTGVRSRFSSCPPDRAYYTIEAKKFVFYPGNRIEGYDVYAHVGGFPVFYSPYYEFALGYRNPLYLFPAIGSNAAQGNYVKNTLIYNVSRELQTEIFVDVLERMGYGTGFKARVNKASRFPSEIYAYSISPQQYAYAFRQGADLSVTQNYDLSMSRRQMIRSDRNPENSEQWLLRLRHPAVGGWVLRQEENLLYGQVRQTLEGALPSGEFRQKMWASRYLQKEASSAQDQLIYEVQTGRLNQRLQVDQIRNGSDGQQITLMDEKMTYAFSNEYRMALDAQYRRELSGGDQWLSPRFSLFYTPSRPSVQWGLEQAELKVNRVWGFGAVSANQNREMTEALAEIGLSTRPWSWGGIDYTSRTTLGSYHERKNVGVIRETTASRMLFASRWSGTFLRINPWEVSAQLGLDQYLYDTGDKQFEILQTWKSVWTPLRGVGSESTYSRRSHHGYTPFYFDEIKTDEQFFRHVLNLEPLNGLRFQVEDRYNLNNSLREPERYTLSYESGKTIVAGFTTGYDDSRRVWDSLQSWVRLQKDEENYLLMNTSYSLMKGQIDSSLLSFGATWENQDLWKVKGGLQWNASQKAFRFQKLSVIRDMGCVQMSYEWEDARQEHVFMVTVKAFPEQAIGWGVGVDGVQLRGIGETGAQR